MWVKNCMNMSAKNATNFQSILEIQSKVLEECSLRFVRTHVKVHSPKSWRWLNESPMFHMSKHWALPWRNSICRTSMPCLLQETIQRRVKRMRIVCVKHSYICQLETRECPECETFEEKLERAYLKSKD